VTTPGGTANTTGSEFRDATDGESGTAGVRAMALALTPWFLVDEL